MNKSKTKNILAKIIKNIFTETNIGGETTIRYWAFIAAIFFSYLVCYFISGLILIFFDIKNETYPYHNKYTDEGGIASTQGEIGAVIWIILSFIIYSIKTKTFKSIKKILDHFISLILLSFILAIWIVPIVIFSEFTDSSLLKFAIIPIWMFVLLLIIPYIVNFNKKK